MGSRLEKNSTTVRRRIENHTFSGEDGEEYSASKFGGFSDYMRRKKTKLQNLDAQLRAEIGSDKPQIFKNVVAHVNGYTQPSLSDLHLLIVSHGGGFLQYLDGKTAVTHIIASQLTPKKKAEFAKYRIVQPSWVVESVAAGRLLSWENYRVVDEGVTQKVLGFDGGVVTSQANTKQHSYKSASEKSWYNSQVRGVATRLDGDIEDLEGPRDVNIEQDLLEQLANTDSQDDSFYKPADLSARGDFSLEQQTSIRNVDRADFTTPTAARESARLTSEAQKIGAGPSGRLLSAEEHNAILLQNPHMAKSSTANPDFLNQYYRESRLHHLSTWKAELKAQLQARAVERSSQQNKPKRPPGTRRYILHVDFDSFFVAVGLLKSPHLKDKPVVVAHGTGPGSEIASCNYPARRFGIKNGMWMKHALELCKDINVLPYDYPAYEEASKHFYDSILSMDGVVQSISIDEALIDISEACIRAGGSDGRGMHQNAGLDEQNKALELATSLRTVVRQKTGCDVSVGIGGNILLAKIALRKAKPAGQFLLKPEAVLDFIADLTVVDLPGFAHSVSNKLEEVGVKFVRDIRAMSREKLMTTLGPKTGERLWEYARGIDKTEVGEQVVRKSVSAEVNWGIRFTDQQQAEEFVLCLCEELAKRLLENLVKGRQLTMKIMRKAADAGLDPPKNLGHGKCDTFNKSTALGVATNDGSVLGREAVAILRSYNFPPGELRGLGVQMQRLEPLNPVHAAASKSVESSQRRLQFKKPSAVSTTPVRTPFATIGAVAEAVTPEHSEPPTTTASDSRLKRRIDPIEDTMSPKRNKVSPAISDLFPAQAAGNTMMNVSGTQFVIPTQIDPAVLDELPDDIRARLVRDPRRAARRVSKAQTPDLEVLSRSQSPFVGEVELALPTQSQLDPATLAELPEDVREELLAQYGVKTTLNPNRAMQQLLPQSPRKDRVIMSKKTSLTPTKRQKVKSLLPKGRRKVGREESTLTQSAFVSINRTESIGAEPLVADQDISVSFLEELPEEIRHEILTEQKRQRMKHKGGLNVGTARRKMKTIDPDIMRGQQRLVLPKHSARPTFTSRKLCDLPDLRDAMSSWVQAFSGDGEVGPHDEDTRSLALYLQRVVSEEHDIDKAQSVVNWLTYVVNDWPFTQDERRSAWRTTLECLKEHIQTAVKQRGLAPLYFDD